MMYSFTWSSVWAPGGSVTPWNQKQYPDKKIGDPIGGAAGKDVADYIKNSKDCSFFFCLSNFAGEQGHSPDQKPQFDQWIKENQLEEYVKFYSSGISNPVHQERKYSLNVVIMQSKDHSCPMELKEGLK